MYYGLISSMKKTVASAYTARTTAFIAATGISDTTIINALNTMDLSLISAGLDTKMKALYPFVGGTASTHKYNFMDARDLDAAFRIVFNGGWTHSSTGAKPNGTNAYADTKFNALTNFMNTIPYGLSIGIGYYSRTNSNGTEIELGASSNILIEVRTTGTTYGRAGQNGAISFVDADSLGFYNFNRLNAITEKGYKNGVLKATSTAGLGIYPNLNIYLGAWNQVTPAYFSTKESAFSSIGDGLSDSEASALYSAVQTMQTSLARNV